jgi:hypothetical protein
MLTKLRAWIARDLIDAERRSKVAAFEEAGRAQSLRRIAELAERKVKGELEAAKNWTEITNLILAHMTYRERLELLEVREYPFAVPLTKEEQAEYELEMKARLIERIVSDWLRGEGVTVSRVHDKGAAQAFLRYAVNTRPQVYTVQFPIREDKAQ